VDEEKQIEAPPAAAPPRPEPAAPHPVEVPVSALVHLMGLATAAEVKTLETKLDLLLSRFTAVSLKVERIATQLSTLSTELSLERMELQLTDIRAIMKKLFPQLAGSDLQDPAKAKGGESPRPKE
jgi:hypothetical protein